MDQMISPKDKREIECLPGVEIIIPENINIGYEACDKKVEAGK